MQYYYDLINAYIMDMEHYAHPDGELMSVAAYHEAERRDLTESIIMSDEVVEQLQIKCNELQNEINERWSNEDSH